MSNRSSSTRQRSKTSARKRSPKGSAAQEGTAKDKNAKAPAAKSTTNRKAKLLSVETARAVSRSSGAQRRKTKGGNSAAQTKTERVGPDSIAGTSKRKQSSMKVSRVKKSTASKKSTSRASASKKQASSSRTKAQGKSKAPEKSKARGKKIGASAKTRSSASRRQSTATSKRSSSKPAQRSAANKNSEAKGHLTALKPRKLANEQLLSAYEEMLRARLNDEKSIVLYKQNKCFFQIGCAGHEAIGVACGKVFRAGKDWFYPYYRDMALCAALGMSDREFMLNCMNKQDDPNSHGRQMPMHYGSKALNIVNQSSPTGTQFLQAVGAAMAIKKQGRDEVVYVSAGEGTCSQGDFHEALNWAAREKLPVVFVVQNNVYAISVPIWEQIAGGSVSNFGRGYEGLATYEIDGTDYEACFATVEDAYQRAQRGEGPALIEAHVPRLQSHSISDNHLKYRSQEDIDAEQKRCPISKTAALLKKRKAAPQTAIDQMAVDLKAAIDEAAVWAEEQPDADPTAATEHTYCPANPALRFEEGTAEGEEVYMVDALNHALHEEMARNEDMVIFGQDVAHGKGGVFTVTTGLTDKFGTERVYNAPLAEASIVGVAVGMATLGMRPVAEIQFGDYIWTGMMQIRNELAMMRYRSGGDFHCPAVLRVPVGGYIRGGCYHSQNIEATFAHFPGLMVVLPSNARDAKGLLKASIRSSDPVLFLEHKGLYRQVYAKGAEGDKDFLIPLGKARVVREGADLTIITWGALVNKSMLAAEKLFEELGVAVEVVDLRTIVPFDRETVFESVRKTGRVLIAHEDVEFMGFGAEVATQIAEQCFESLDAPVKRLGMKNVAAVAHAPGIESVVLPQSSDVVAACEALLSY